MVSYSGSGSDHDSVSRIGRFLHRRNDRAGKVYPPRCWHQSLSPVLLCVVLLHSALANPAGLHCLEQKGKSKPFSTRHSHMDTFDGDGAVCVVDGSECEEWAFLRRECAKGDVKASDSGRSKDHWLCAVRGGEFHSIGDGIGGSCKLPRGGGKEFLSLDSKGKLVQCNCDPDHSARCWKETDGYVALQRREARGEGALHTHFGQHVITACQSRATQSPEL